MVEIRKAKLKDLEKISAMAIDLLKYHQKFDDYYQPAKNANKIYNNYFRSKIFSRKSLLLVAESGGKPVGYALCSIKKKAPIFAVKKYGEISDVYVTDQFRQQGIAGLFLKELKKWLNNNKIEYIELNAHTKNKISQRVYQKYGFKDFLIRKRFKI